MNNKGQGLSITTIVIAAIALLILVVLVAVFTGQIGGFTQTMDSCDSAGGQCLNESAGDTIPEDHITDPSKNCDGGKCYVPLNGSG